MHGLVGTKDALNIDVNPQYVLKIQLIPHREECAPDKPVCKYLFREK
jgi:hypothetical protein